MLTENCLTLVTIKIFIKNPIQIPYKYPLRLQLAALAPDWAHLGDSFDEVIGFITTSALPGCADRSVSSSEYRRTEYDKKLSRESLKY